MSQPADITSEFYRHLCDGSNIAIIATDSQGLVISLNKAAQVLLGHDASGLPGKKLESIVPQEYSLILREAFDKAVNQAQTSEFELGDIPEGFYQGDLSTLLLTVAPVVDNRDSVIGVSVWMRDITRRKVLQQQLLQAEKMASLGTLASGVAHHFNNIIGGVATFVDYALISNNPQASRRALQMTAEAAGRIGQITSSLLTFAEKDMRQCALSDLTEVVLTFSHLVEKPLAEKNIKLEMHLQAVPVYEVPGSRIHQVLGNLFDNAECAMSAGGTITISVGRDGSDLVMTVSDTGTGIAPDVLPHIFEPFFTTRGTIAGGNQRRSSGLGLSVVHGIISELGGQIQVASKPGRGTTFTIQFPFEKKQ